MRTILISESGYDPYRVQFTAREFAARNPEVVAKFVRASVRGWQQYLRSPEATNAHLLTLNPALNPAQEAYTAKLLKDGAYVSGSTDGGSGVGSMTAERWQATCRQLQALGIVQPSFDSANAYSLQYPAR